MFCYSSSGNGPDAMTLDVSVCGLIVIPQREPQGYECALRQVTLAELDLSVALNFARGLVRTEAETTGLADCSMIAAAFHPGKVEVCPGIEYADQPVEPSEEIPGPDQWFTVCGFYADTWQTYSGYQMAATPRMAYLQAWREVANTHGGRYLYVANVHLGQLARHPVPGTQAPPAYGDPACETMGQMASAMDELLGKG
jgi:hypothetical protein